MRQRSGDEGSADCRAAGQRVGCAGRARLSKWGNAGRPCPVPKRNEGNTCKGQVCFAYVYGGTSSAGGTTCGVAALSSEGRRTTMLTLSIWSTIRRLMRYARSQHLRASQERCGYRTQIKSAVERANFGKQKYPGAQLGQTWASLRRPRWHRLRFRSWPLRLCQLPSPPQLQLFHRFSTRFFIRMPPHPECSRVFWLLRF